MSALGPMQDRMHAQMRAGRRRSVEVVPEFRRLVANVPIASAPRGENTRSLARVGSSSRRMPAIKPSKPCLASASLSPSVLRAAERAAGGKRRVDRLDRRAMLDDQIEIPFLRVALAERIHLRKFLAGIDMHHRKRHAAEERLARKPDHHVGIFAERPQQRDLLQPRKRLAENENALRFEIVETVHHASLRRRCESRAAGVATRQSSLFSANEPIRFSRSPLFRVEEYFSVCSLVSLLYYGK